MLNLKEHFKLTAIYTFFAAFPAVLQLVVYPLIEGNDRLGSEDFGYLAVAEAILSFIAIFFLFGMAMAIARFYYDYNDNRKDYNTLVSTIFQGIVFRSILILGIVLLFAKPIGKLFTEGPLQDFETYGIYLVIIAFNRTVIAVALSLYRSEKSARNFVITSLISGLGRSTMQVVGVLYFDMSFKGYLMGTAIGGGVASSLVIIYTFYKCGFSFSKSINNQIYKYSFLLFLTDIMFWGILFFDRFMLMKTPIALGIYDNAIKFAIGVQFISQGLAGSIQPELYRFFKKGVKENEKKIKSLSNLFIAENIVIVGVMILPLMIFIHLFYETNLVLSAGLILIILMRTIINALYQVFLWPILYVKATKTYLYLNTIVVFIVVILNILLVPKYGYYGSITAFLTAGIVQVVLFYQAGQKIIHISWSKTKLLYFPLGIIVFVGLLEIVKNIYSINAFYTSIFAILTMFSGLTFMYREELKSNWQKIIKKS